MKSRVMTRVGVASLWLLAAFAAVAGCSSDSGADAALPATDAAIDAAIADAAANDPLPASLKGYELYAWDEDGEIAYTLITGTNRQKTVAEITTDEPAVQGGDWVVIRGHGLSSLERLLVRVPAGTEVFLSELEGLPALSDAHRRAATELLGA